VYESFINNNDDITLTPDFENVEAGYEIANS
jgi:hypothetical protein